MYDIIKEFSKFNRKFDVDRDTAKQIWLRDKRVKINNRIPDDIYINPNVINGALYEITNKVINSNKQFSMNKIKSIFIDVVKMVTTTVYFDLKIEYIDISDIDKFSIEYKTEDTISTSFTIFLPTHYNKYNGIEYYILDNIISFIDKKYCKELFGIYDIVDAFNYCNDTEDIEDYDTMMNNYYILLSTVVDKYKPFVYLFDEEFKNSFEYKGVMEQVFYKFMKLYIPNIPVFDTTRDFTTAEQIIYNTEFDVEFDGKDRIHTLKTSIKDYKTGEVIYFHKASTMNKTPKSIVKDLIMKSAFNFIFYKMLDHNPDNLVEVEFARTLCDMMISDSLMEYKGGYK